MKIVSFKLKFENVVVGECFKLNGMEYRKIEPVGLYNCVSEDMTMALMKPATKVDIITGAVEFTKEDIDGIIGKLRMSAHGHNGIRNLVQLLEELRKGENSPVDRDKANEIIFSHVPLGGKFEHGGERYTKNSKNSAMRHINGVDGECDRVVKFPMGVVVEVENEH